MTGYARRLRRIGVIALVAALLSLGAAVSPAAAAGGRFAASYHGRFTFTPFGRRFAEVAITASGFATFLGPSRAAAGLILTFSRSLCDSITGSDTLTADSGGTIVVRFTGVTCFTPRRPHVHQVTLTYQVTGGTGRFSGASGSGTIGVVAVDENTSGTVGAAVESWSGTLLFAG